MPPARKCTGAPPSETLYKILQVLYTEKEAKVGGAASGPSFYAEESGKGLGDYRSESREAVGSSV